MKYPIYTGTATQRRPEPLELPAARRDRFAEAAHYYPDPGLVDAVNVALLMGQPLLLTGEPGTGKTQLAYSLAWELGFPEPLKFETKSTSSARDLFYTYDSLKRFQDAQEQKSHQTALDYITYNALGEAILRANETNQVQACLPPEFQHNGPTQCVVLIDEVDKAPRDFPNDILNELENLYFRVPELGNVKLQAPPERHPIVLITSNSEKDLPDAFLRRCIYYHIPFPEDQQLRTIIAARLALSSGAGNAFLSDALSLFRLLRSPEIGLRKRPATAELLGWLEAMKRIAKTENPLADPELALKTLGNLVKTSDDLNKAREIVAEWGRRQRSAGSGPIEAIIVND